MPRHALLAVSMFACTPPAAGDGHFGGGSLGPDLPSSSSSGASTTVAGSTTAATTLAATTVAETSGDVGDGDPPGGGDADLGVVQGCEGKLDFLFVITNSANMEVRQPQLQAALPEFIEAIGSRFSLFDNHVMVLDTDGAFWGSVHCQDCVDTCPAGPTDYPCWANVADVLQPCDAVPGAGVTFSAGHGAPNERCAVWGGNRYMVAGAPDPVGTFLCLASVGFDGATPGAPMDSLLAAITPEINGPGGCNAGFLRPGALLVITVITPNGGDGTPGDPKAWAEAVLAAKGEDQDAVVLLQLLTDEGLPGGLCYPNETPDGNDDPLRAFGGHFEHSLVGSICSPAWGPFFEEATALVLEQCDLFSPPR